MSRPRPATGTDQVVRRAARRIGLQAGVAAAFIVIALAAVALVLTGRAQDDADQQLVRQTATMADDVKDPPPSCWIVLLTSTGRVQSTQGVPASVVDRTALRAAARTGVAAETDVHVGGGHYLVHTQARAGGAVQVVLDLGPSDRRWHTLVTWLAVAAGTGLLLAGLVGWAMARRVLVPLRRSLALQRQFVADASHELRTPLTLLHTRLQLLHQGLTSDGRDDQSVEDASALLRDSDRLVELVDDLLVAADPLAAPDVHPVPLSGLVGDVLAAMAPHAAQRQVELTGGTVDEPVVAGSAVALRRALIALLDNAIEHTPPGGSVAVTARPVGNVVRIEVSDTGTGFDAAARGRLFDRFHSGEHGTRRRHGLGLALVSDVVDRHGGHIEVHSEPGQGARFTLTIPRSRRGNQL